MAERGGRRHRTPDDFGMAYDAGHDLLHFASVESNQSLVVTPVNGMMGAARPELAFAGGRRA
jgi:hypothetical protein